MSPTFRIILLLLMVSVAAKAQRFSYVYIQGDKQTPFYVKLNGEMQPRYGKNYCILPQLEAGTIKIEILFQQNIYPAQQFTILVPESGARSFMITRRDQNFSLYDLQQRFYLPAGNAESDDHMPVVNSTINAVASHYPTEEVIAAEPMPVRILPNKKERVRESKKEIVRAVEEEPLDPVSNRRTRRAKAGETAETTQNDTPKEQQPQFLDNVQLQNDHAQVATPANSSANLAANSDTTFTQKKPLDISFRNSDCPQPMTDGDFEHIYKAMMQKPNDEDRIDYLNGQMDKCYQTWQARTLGTMLTEDAARFTFLKNVYPRITDQQAFPLLDDMLRSEVWKTQFYQLTHR